MWRCFGGGVSSCWYRSGLTVDRSHAACSCPIGPPAIASPTWASTRLLRRAPRDAGPPSRCWSGETGAKPVGRAPRAPELCIPHATRAPLRRARHGRVRRRELVQFRRVFRRVLGPVYGYLTQSTNLRELVHVKGAGRAKGKRSKGDDARRSPGSRDAAARNGRC